VGRRDQLECFSRPTVNGLGHQAKYSRRVRADTDTLGRGRKTSKCSTNVGEYFAASQSLLYEPHLFGACQPTNAIWEEFTLEARGAGDVV